MKTIILLFIVSALCVFAQPPVLRNYFTTNTTFVDLDTTTNIAKNAVSTYTGFQPASANLTNFTANGTKLSVNNGADLTNIPPTALAMGWSGAITNRSTTVTNIEYFSNGVLTNAYRNP